MSASIGIAAHNEAANIGRLLAALTGDAADDGLVSEIIVVASGCTDRTERIIGDFAAVDRRVRLLAQPRREGKAAAVNLLIGQAAEDVLLLVSADTLPAPGAVRALLAPFADPAVGVTAGRIVPRNPDRGLMGSYVNLFWRLHHQVALRGFKAGEAVAFRRVIAAIPDDTATDETWIVRLVEGRGLGARYVPEAVFFNRGPATVGEFLAVRRRQLAGYHHLRTLRPGWELPGTMDNPLVLRLMAGEVRRAPFRAPLLAGAMLLEALARALARYDYFIAGRNPHIWEMAGSARRPDCGP